MKILEKYNDKLPQYLQFPGLKFHGNLTQYLSLRPKPSFVAKAQLVAKAKFIAHTKFVA